MNDYVLLESPDKQIRGFDSYVTAWESALPIVEEWMDDLEPGQPKTLKVTVLQMTAEQFERYCEDNGVETP